jgi:hypothetical protein
MALVLADRVRETTTTTGTGSVTLAGAYTGFQTFSAAVGNTNSTYYTIANVGSGEWEVGIGTYSSGGNLLSRTTVLASSNAGSLVNFGAGAKDVFVTQPAERALYIASAGTGLESKVTAFTNGGIVYASSTSALATGSALTWNGSNLAVTGTLSATGNTTIGAGSGSPQLKLSGAASSTANSGAQLAFAAAGTPYAYISNVAWIKGGGSTDNNLAYWTDTGLGHYFYANNNATTAVAAITSTGLAVTGTLSAQTTSGLFGVAAYGGSSVKLTSSATMAYEVASTFEHQLRVNSITIGNFGSTGLAVTGTFSSTLGATIQGLTVGLGAGAVATNTAVGVSALAANTTGDYSTALGNGALNSQTDGRFNTALGWYTLFTNISGTNNTASGYQSLYLNTASNNTGYGNYALRNNASGASNVAVGSLALQANTTASNNTAVGYQAGYNNQTGPEVTAVGYQAGFRSTAGYSTFVGHGSGVNQSTGDSNTYVGRGITGNAAAGASTGSNNTAMGNFALSNVTSGSSNVAIGPNALNSNTSASNNTAVGYQAGYTNQTGAQNTDVGMKAGYLGLARTYTTSMGYFAGYSSNGTSNTYIGYASGPNNGTTSVENYNTGIGAQALNGTTTGSNNTAVGYQAGYTNTTGARNVAIGLYARNTPATGDNNIGIGAYALQSTGSSNVAVGDIAMATSGSGSFNTALGAQSLYSNTTASNNTAVGYQAGYTTKTGTGNVFLGYQAGYTNQAGNDNTFVGNGAGYGGGQPNYGNTAIGIGAGGLLGAGANYNTFLGVGAGGGVTTGGSNVIIGAYSGAAAPISATGSGYIVLSDGAGNPRQIIDSSGKVFIGGTSQINAGKFSVYFESGTTSGIAIKPSNNDSGATPMQFNSFGNTNVGSITTTASACAFNNLSDYRVKQNISPLVNALEKVSRLKPCTYTFILDNSNGEGFIAHELAEVCPQAVTGTKDAVDENGSPKYQGVDTSFLVATLTAAIQELKAEVDSLKSQLNGA